jgi:hypothetical protein
VSLFAMTHYVQRQGKEVHVTNVVMGCVGQHHVHTPAGFKRWAKGVEPRALDTKTLAKCDPCDCGQEVEP